MAKSFLRWSKASSSTKRKVEAIIRQGNRAVRRSFVAADRRTIRALKENGGHGHA